MAYADAVFSQLGGPSAGIGECKECRAALIANRRAQITVINARFNDPVPKDEGALYILAANGSQVLIERSSLVANGPTARVVVDIDMDSRIYSDEPERVLLHNTNNVRVDFDDIEDIPVAPAEGDRFLKPTDEWFTSVQEVAAP